MVAKRNIDAVLGAVAQGHGEIKKRQTSKPKPAKPADRPETVVATFTFAVGFLAQIRRIGLDWRDRNIPASSCREGAVIQALARAAMDDPKALECAAKNAINRKG